MPFSSTATSVSPLAVPPAPPAHDVAAAASAAAASAAASAAATSHVPVPTSDPPKAGTKPRGSDASRFVGVGRKTKGSVRAKMPRVVEDNGDEQRAEKDRHVDPRAGKRRRGEDEEAAGAPASPAPTQVRRSDLEDLFPKKLTAERLIKDAKHLLGERGCLDPGVFWSRFSDVEFLGSGAFGLVWRATMKATKQAVAVKSAPLLTATVAEINDAYSVVREVAFHRFLTEQGTPSVLPLHAAYYVEGSEPWPKGMVGLPETFAGFTLAKALEASATIFMVLDLCDGDLDVLCCEQAPQTREATAVGVRLAVAGALARMHSLAVVHLDLKPANILFRRSVIAGARDKVEYFLADFGNCHLVGPRASSCVKAIGTYEYMDTQALKYGKCDRATDCYSLGCVLYEVLKGEQLCPPCQKQHKTHKPQCYVAQSRREIPDDALASFPAQAGVVRSLLNHDRNERCLAEQAAGHLTVLSAAGC